MSKEREGAASINAHIAAKGAGRVWRSEGQQKAGSVGAKQLIKQKHYPPIIEEGLYSHQASCSSELYPAKAGMQVGSGLSTAQSTGAPGLQQYHQMQRHLQQQGSAMLNSNANQSSTMMIMSMGNINTSTPCAACKLLRRRCAQECPFAPYFSPHEPQRFASVHKIYGASNVSKMLLEVPEMQRADAANSLVYEANARLRDPVYGCMGLVSSLQQQAQALQAELNAVKGEVMCYRAAAAMAGASTGGSSCSNSMSQLATQPQPPQLNTPATPNTPPLAALDHVGHAAACQAGAGALIRSSSAHIAATSEDTNNIMSCTPAGSAAEHYVVLAHFPRGASSSVPLSSGASLPPHPDPKDRLLSWP